MNELQIFNFDGNEVRTLTIDNEPYFIGKDVCKAFGDSNHNRSIGRVDDIDKRVEEITDSMGRKQKALFVNESGLYSLLFAMQPQKAHHDGVSDEYPIEIQERIDKLHRFKRWVTAEVLPAIRKHGAYLTDKKAYEITHNPNSLADLLIRIDKLHRFKRWVTAEVLPAIRKHGAYLTDKKAYEITHNPNSLADLLIQAGEQLRKKDLVIQEMQPKALFADAVATSKTSILIGELAKILKQNGINTGQRRLFEQLRNDGYLIKRAGTDYNMPTQKAMEQGLFEIKETVVTHADGHVAINKTPKVTGKGQQFFIKDYNMPTQKAMEQGLFEIKETVVTHADGHVAINKTPKVTGKGQQFFINKYLKQAED